VERRPLLGRGPRGVEEETSAKRKDDVTGTRCHIALFALAAAVATVLAVTPAKASAASLDKQLSVARMELRHAKVRLADARETLDAAIAAHQKRGVGSLVLDVRRARHGVRFWTAVTKDLRAEQARMRAARAAAGAGDWKTLCRRAAREYRVSAGGLYRLLMMESGGKARAVSSGRYYGLFQYTLFTWRGDWNPWRGHNVFDGAAQIQASAYAVSRGMGRSLWGNTYPAAF